MKKLHVQIAIICFFIAFAAVFCSCKKDLNTASGNTGVSAFNTSNASALAVTSNDKVETDIAVSIPCANAGAGETIQLSGSLHIVFHTTVNGNNFVSKSHYQPQGISGVSELTGEKYQATGGTQEVFSGSFVNGKFADTYTNNFRIVGQGTGNNYLVHETFHLTVNANGTVSTTFDKLSIDCK